MGKKSKKPWSCPGSILEREFVSRGPYQSSAQWGKLQLPMGYFRPGQWHWGEGRRLNLLPMFCSPNPFWFPICLKLKFRILLSSSNIELVMWWNPLLPSPALYNVPLLLGVCFLFWSRCSLKLSPPSPFLGTSWWLQGFWMLTCIVRKTLLGTLLDLGEEPDSYPVTTCGRDIGWTLLLWQYSSPFRCWLRVGSDR